MPLTRGQIKRLGLVEDGIDDCYRDIGYDLRVGQIYVPKDDHVGRPEQTVESCSIPPQGMVMIFSQEKVKIPGNICGFAMPKTRLCEDGIHVLNTGILDPCYEGRISGTAINFRRTHFPLQRGTRFLRLVFERVEASSMPEDRIDYSEHRPEDPDEYIQRRIGRAREYPGTFLNVPQTVKDVGGEIAETVLSKERRFFVLLLAAGAVIVGVAQFGAALVSQYIVSPEKITKAAVDEVRTQAVIGQTTAMEELRHRIESLEKNRPRR